MAFSAAIKGSPSTEALQYLQEKLVERLEKMNTLVGVAEIEIIADATGGVVVPVPLGATIIDILVIGTAASSGGTVTFKNGTTTICTALAMAADGTVARMAAGVVKAELLVDVADTITAVAGQSADRGLIKVLYRL